ncbi:DUF6293 family protein [Haloarchaeobius sp. FL176]|uniref:HFX_2341 family transcriptional regulator domain-containing protein n=1 Tax=Haloarchaeobius sp. FL176 TaxID=2967129 RepID=UPI0021491E89|nr:DUF6293 family protein [Haloarchaeobius sp. FL176]
MVNAPDRIHIAPQGYETERIFEPVIEQKADLVYLLVAEDESEQGHDCRIQVVERLDEEGIEVEEIECPLFDFQAAFREISRLIQEHPDDYVAVNISSGSKITAISGTLACMLNNGEPYYVKVGDYGEEPVNTDVQGLVDIPTYPITRPDTDLVRILNYIAEENESDNEPNISDVIDFALEESLSVIEDSESESQHYHIIQPQVIQPLSEQGYLKIISYGGEKRLQVTEKGLRTIELSSELFE